MKFYFLSCTAQNCLTPENAPGNCINFRYCSFVVNLIVQNQQKPDEAITNYLKKTICGEDGQDPKVCCPALVFSSLTGTTTAPSVMPNAPFIFSSLPTSLNPQQAPNSGSSSGSLFSPSLTFSPVTNTSTIQTTTPRNVNQNPVPPNLNSLPSNEVNKCGMVMAVRSRIVGGQQAVPGSYPWLAAVGYNFTNGTQTSVRFLCGGTLITQRHVMSAGHCIIPSLLLVRLGAYDITLPADNVNVIDSFITNYFLHESYDPKSISNDISILKLDRTIAITNYVRPACIPLSNELRYKDWTGASGWVAGWGATSFNGVGSQTLLEVMLPVIATATCAFNYKLYFPSQVFDDKIMCAGFQDGGKDSCQGDSGGGLVAQQLSSDGSFYYYNVIGIVSYGFECARPGFPGIYTRVTTFIPWIQSKIIL